MSLVADYGTSDSEEQEENQELNSTDDDSDASDDDAMEQQNSLSFGQPLRSDETQSKLPSARGLLEGGDSIGVGVFKNPYKDVEDKKIATLEKHVKMVESGAKVRVINGKKVCWAYRKGKCRFGSSCQYAHDSDLIAQVEAQEARSSKGTGGSGRNQGTNTHKPAAGKVKKKRPGLGNTLVPGKKALDMYSRLKDS